MGKDVKHHLQSKILLAIFALTLPILVIVSTLLICTYDLNFYQDFFVNHNIEAVTSIDSVDLTRVAEQLIAYLQGRMSTIQTQAVIAGQLRAVFTEREILHMQDVKQLFNLAMILGIVSFIFNAVSGMFIWKKYGKKSLAKALDASFKIALMVVIFIGLLMRLDFYHYFTIFHEILFTNDLWLLDPQKHVLIQMLPLVFFINMAKRILIWFSAVMISLEIMARLVFKRERTSQ